MLALFPEHEARMPIELPVSRFRTGFSTCLNHHLVTGERIVLTRHGHEVAALVSLKDLRALENVERAREDFLEQRHAERMREFRMLKEGLL